MPGNACVGRENSRIDHGFDEAQCPALQSVGRYTKIFRWRETCVFLCCFSTEVILITADVGGAVGQRILDLLGWVCEGPASETELPEDLQESSIICLRSLRCAKPISTTPDSFRLRM